MEKWQQEARTESDCGCGAEHSQLPPAGPWSTWYIRGGRGSGKTRTGAETLRDWIVTNPPGDWAIVAPTDGAARKVCMEGRHSGLIQAFGGRRSPLIADYRRTDGTLTLWNGSRVLIDGADDGALRIQGENLSGAWCDEVGLWRDWDLAWNESLLPAVRMEPGKIIATGTPKMGHGLVKQLLEDPGVPSTHMRTVDNIDNLPEERVLDLYARFAGKRRGRQELEGEFIEDVEGALWSAEQLEKQRASTHPELARIVVAVDPSGSSKESAHNAGIVVCGLEPQGLHNPAHGFVLADRTTHGSPEKWARAAISAYHEYRADALIAETNYGGELVRVALNAVDPKVPVRLIQASRGKQIRAEPVAQLYEQQRVWHVGVFPDLEAEMTSWVPGAGVSDDRMDALVWALTDLMLDKHEGGQGSYMPQASVPVVRRGDLVLRGDRYIDKT